MSRPVRIRKEFNFPKFSLVELVVLITIITSVLSLVVPVLYRNRAQAKSVHCADNLRQIGIWTLAYCGSYDGFLPDYESGWVERIGSIGDHNLVPGAEPKGPLSCPSQSFTSLKDGVSAADYWRGSQYGLNQHISSSLQNRFNEYYPEWTQLNIQRISQPSIKVLAADASGGNYYDIEGRDPVIAGISRDGVSYVDGLPPNPARPFPYLRHINGSGNFLYLDGHVESKKTWPAFARGPGVPGFRFWNGEHRLINQQPTAVRR